MINTSRTDYTARAKALLVGKAGTGALVVLPLGAAVQRVSTIRFSGFSPLIPLSGTLNGFNGGSASTSSLSGYFAHSLTGPVGAVLRTAAKPPVPKGSGWTGIWRRLWRRFKADSQ